MARTGRPTAKLVLSDEERQTLQRWARRPKSAQALALRARIVLACAEGATNKDVADEVSVTAQMVGKWRARFAAGRAVGRRSTGPATHDHRRPGRAGGDGHAGAGSAGRGHALVDADDGCPYRADPNRGIANLAGLRAQ